MNKKPHHRENRKLIIEYAKMVLLIKQTVLLWVMVLLVVLPSFAEENKLDIDTIAEILAKGEVAQMQIGLKAWTNQKMVEMLTKQGVTNLSVNDLHQYFKEIVVFPPDPDAYTEYSIENAEASLIRTKLLGITLHNLYLSLNKKDYEKYGKLIGSMRDVLYLDVQHIPLAIKHDNSRDFYWYSLHNKGVKVVDEEYIRIFENEEAL